jgi:ribonuclease HI
MQGGGSVVICDQNASYDSGACHFFPYHFDVEGAELLACRHGLDLASDMQLEKVILETDSIVVVAKLIMGYWFFL